MDFLMLCNLPVLRATRNQAVNFPEECVYVHVLVPAHVCVCVRVRARALKKVG